MDYPDQENGRSCDTPPKPYASTASVPPNGSTIQPNLAEPSAGASSGERGASYPSTDSEPIAAPAAYSTLPHQLTAVARWLLWHYRHDPGKPKPAKIPTYLNGHQRNGALDTPEDTAQLCRFADAYGALLVSGKHEGLALACGEVAPGVYLQMADYDGCTEEQVRELLANLPGYRERSPGGKGVRQFGIGRYFQPLNANGSGVEAYPAKRFATVTGHGYGEPVDIADFVEQKLAREHARGACVPASTESSPGDAAVWISPQELNELRLALFSMRSDEYELWIRMGQALKTLGDVGRGLWMAWSATSDQFDPAEARKKWDGFDPHTIDHKAVFAEAQRRGWLNPNSNEARAASMPPAAALVVPAPEVPEDQLAYPPGFTGALAWQIEQTAIRPVREYAIAAALAIVNGVAARGYTVSGTGLNLYMLAIGRSATGKEVLHEGPSKVRDALIAAGYVTAPSIIQFVDFASGPALRKHVNKNPCSLTVCGEWGRKMRSLSDTRNTAMQSLRTEMTNLYHKSAPGNTLAAVAYSSKDESIGETAGAAYSMLAETTPGTYDESLTDEMAEDGFLSRFHSMEYPGERPGENPAHLKTLVGENGEIHPVIKALGDLMHQALNNVANRAPTPCTYTPEAKALRDAFNAECDKHIRDAGANEALRAPWNRADLKAQKIAAGTAAGDNPMFPVISEAHMRWAIDFARRDAMRYLRKFKNGDIGSNDGTRIQKVLQFCTEYMQQPLSASYADCEHLKAESVVSYRYLEVRARRNKAFNKHPLGHARALADTLRSLCDSAHLELLPDLAKTQLGARTAKLYWIRQLDE